MLGRRNIRESIGYVTLGLFSHALLNELSEAKSTPHTPPQKSEMINIAIQSLQAITSPKEVDPSCCRNLVFQNYQEARTLYGVFTRQNEINKPNQLMCILDEIVQDRTTKSKRLTHINKAIKFFGELSKMAVMNAERPEERVPPGVRNLVAARAST